MYELKQAETSFCSRSSVYLIRHKFNTVLQGQKCPVFVVCLPRPMEGMGRLQFSDFFFTELPVPPHAAGVVGTFNVPDIYPTEHYGLIFLTLRMPFFLQGLLFLYTFPFCKYTLHQFDGLF